VKIAKIFLFTILFVSCDDFEYTGHLPISEKQFEYIPFRLGDTVIYKHSSGELLKLEVFDTLFSGPLKSYDDAHFTYFSYEKYMVKLKNIDSTFVMFYQLDGGSYNKQVSFYVHVKFFIDNLWKYYFLPLHSEAVDNYDSLKYLSDNSSDTWYDTISLDGDIYQNVIKIDSYNESSDECTVQYPCVKYVFYNQEFGVIQLLFSDSTTYTLVH
jgi:hypothetical protein